MRRVVAPAIEQFAAELLLEGLGQIDGCGLGGAGGPHLLQEGRQRGLKGREEILQSGFADVWLVGLGQDFPGAALHPLSAGQLGRLLAPQLDQPLQGRGETGEIVLAPGGLPKGIAAGLGLGDRGDQVWIEGLLAPELLAQQLQVVHRLRGRGPI